MVILTAPGCAYARTFAGDAEMVSLLLGSRDELRRTRELLEAQGSGSCPSQPQSPPHA
jgi:hypothetical protein